MDTPKFDNTPVPKKVLRGGVQHSENSPSAKLSTGASKNTAKLSVPRFMQGQAKADTARQLKANAGQQSIKLNAATNTATIPSGIGIIGVKFVLGFGRPPIINRVFPGTPAADLGLRINDMIVAVDGVPTAGLTKEEVYNMIVGSPGTPVTVSVRRNGDFIARTMNRMDFNDIRDPIVKRDYLLSM